MEILFDNKVILNVVVDDKSHRFREVVGDHTLTLYFALDNHFEIPVGAYCHFQNETYTLNRPENLTMNHTEYFEYTVVFDSEQALLGKFKFRELVYHAGTGSWGGLKRLKFSLNGTPREHLQMLVDNLNYRDEGWSVGECLESIAKIISYNHTFCKDALKQIAETFETEWEIVNKVISLRKVEYNKDNLLELAYGKEGGLKPGIKRENYEESQPIEILYTQGGNRNIDLSRYGSTELLLPKSQTIRFDGTYFEDETGFDTSKGIPYITDENGCFIRRGDKELSSKAEDSLDCSEIYPSRTETIVQVITVDETQHWYDIVADTPENLDYRKYQIVGETPTIIFQDGMLAGREFSLETNENNNEELLCQKAYNNGTFIGWKFSLVPLTQDGYTMPDKNSGYLPVVGGTFKMFGIQLPNEYICDNINKAGASWDMFRQGVKYLYDNEGQKITITGELNGAWAKKDWVNIGWKIRPGGYISFTDSRFQPEKVLIRIMAQKDYINNPNGPEITMSNSPVSRGVGSALNKVESEEVVIDDKYNAALNFTRRRFRDAQELISMLDGAIKGFGKGINPVSVQTMAILLGSVNLQFRFVESRDNLTVVSSGRLFLFDQNTQTFTTEAGVIQHLTLGISDIKPSHKPDEYTFFDVVKSEFNLADSEKAYYLYAQVEKDATGIYILKEESLPFQEGSHYNLLVGILSSEFEGERSFAPLYGFTEVLPGQITTDRILSNDGKTYFDLSTGEIGGNLKFLSSGGEEKKVADLDRFVTEDIQQQVDGKIESWFQSADPSTAWDTDEKRLRHTGDMWYNSSSKTLRRYTGSRWATIEDQTAINAYDTASQAYTAASAAQSTADGKSRVFVATPYPPYSVGDLWVDGDELYRCVTARASGSFDKNDWPLATKYDNTKTVIDGGLITSGTVQLAGQQSDIVAGITGLPRTGETSQSDTDVRIWAGASKENRESAPFRILQDGSFVAQKANIEGTIKAENGRIGRFEIGASRIGVESDSANSSNTGMSLCNYFIRFRDSNSLIALGNSVSSTAENYGEVLLRLECNKSHVLTDITNNIGCIINVTGCPEIYPGLGRNDAVRIEKGNFVMEVKEGSSTPGTAGSIILQPFYYSSRGEVPTRGRTVIALTDGTDSSIQLQAGYNGQTIVVINLTDKEKSIQVANSRLQRNLQVWRSVILTFIKDYGWCPQGD